MFRTFRLPNAKNTKPQFRLTTDWVGWPSLGVTHNQTTDASAARFSLMADSIFQTIKVGNVDPDLSLIPNPRCISYYLCTACTDSPSNQTAVLGYNYCTSEKYTGKRQSQTSCGGRTRSHRRGGNGVSRPLCHLDCQRPHCLCTARREGCRKGC